MNLVCFHSKSFLKCLITRKTEGSSDNNFQRGITKCSGLLDIVAYLHNRIISAGVSVQFAKNLFCLRDETRLNVFIL